MIEAIPDLPENVIGFTAKGKVTVDDYESVIIPAVEEQFLRHNNVRFLYHLGETFSGLEAGAMWDDLKLGMKHIQSWERMAVVTDVEWIRTTIKIFGLVIPGHVRVFHNSEFDEARKWIAG